jgi:hypothetical protein
VTTVRVPVRIRLELAEDRVGDPGLAGLVGSAVAAAAGRAIDRASGVQAVGRSASVDTPSRFSIRFAGRLLPPQVASGLEASIRAALCEAAAGLRTWPGPAAAAAPADTGEERDDDKVIPDPRNSDDDAYLVPSYDQGGRPVAVPLLRQQPASLSRPRIGLRLRYFPDLSALADAVLYRFGGNPPKRLITVSAWNPAEAGGSGETTSISLLEFDGQAWHGIGPWRLFVRLPPAGSEPGREVGYLVHHADTLRFRGSAANRRERIKTLTAIELELLQTRSDQHRASAENLQLKAEMTARDSADPAEGPATIFQLLAGHRHVWAGEVFDKRLPAETMPAVVFTERAEIPEPPAYGSDCPPLDLSSLDEWLNSFGLLNPNLRIREAAFLSEPPIESFPPAVASDLYDQVRAVANQLHLTPGRFVGGFLISVMTDIDRRCRRMATSGRAIGDQLVEIARAFGMIRGLAEFYPAVLVAQDRARALQCPLAGQSETWRLRFYEAYFDARDDAVGSMFVSACQDRLLQVLIRTRREIDRRLDNLDGYARLTRVLLLGLLADTPRLTELRERLKAAEISRAADLMLAEPGLGGWAMGAGELLASMEEQTQPGTPKPGTVEFRNGAYRVLDDTGRWWSAAELDLVLSTAREQALRVDPFLEKVSELPDLVARLQNAQRQDDKAADMTGTRTYQALTDELRSQFGSVLRDNDEYTRKAMQDRSVAFGLATFKEREGEAEIAARMSGIYKVADEFLRPAFTDQDAYAAGVGRLADEEIGRESVKRFFEFVGLAVLAVFFPEVAFVIGVVQSVEALDEALEHRRLQHGMIGGDEILTKAQVEAELWSAAIGAALTVLPEIPAAARGARALIRGEAGEVAAAALRKTLARVTKQLAEASLAHFTTAFAKELTTMYVMNLALSHAIGAIAQAVEEHVKQTGDASLRDLPDLIASAIAAPQGGAP